MKLISLPRIFLYLLINFNILTTTNQFSIDPTNRFILDKHGRYSIFHGGNVVVKLPPYLPILDKFDYQYSLNTPHDLETMKRLGFNSVRLGVIWEAVEKAPGVYDDEYLDKVEQIINTLGENGIYTMVDAHQDVFSRQFCGEGVPYFYVNEMGYDKKCDASALTRILDFVGVCKTIEDFNFRFDENGLPLIEDCVTHNFQDYHFIAGFSSAYRNFYENRANIQDKFVEFWKKVVTRFKDNEYILGYDLWNEPAPGGPMEDIKSFIPGRPDIKDILPVYRKVDIELRKIKPNYILFFENTPVPDILPIFGGLFLGSMDEKPAGDDVPQVYNFHTYCCLSGTDTCAHGEASYDKSIKVCPTFHQKQFKKEIKTAEKLNVPMFLSEFGACSDSLACYNEIISVMKITEENFISWSYWNYKPYGDHTTSAIEMVSYEGIYNDDGTVQNIKEKGLSRGYVMYYQGKPIDFKYQTNSNTNFETSFEYHKNITEPSVLYYNKDFFYKKGYNIQVINDDTKEDLIQTEKVSMDYSIDNYINIKCLENKLDDNTKVRIIFKAK
jgi:endoglycosylceramidase